LRAVATAQAVRDGVMIEGRRGLLVGALVAAVAFGLAVPPAAPAETACWQKVLAAWSAGTLGPNFPVHCYQSAASKLPDDLRGYSSAPDDIHRALFAAIHGDVTRTTGVRHAKETRHLLAASPSRSAGRSWSPLPLLVLAGCVVLVITAGVGFSRRTRRE
jgi:hypothetical protein